MPIGTPALLGSFQIDFASGQTSASINAGTDIQAGDLVVVASFWNVVDGPTTVSDDHGNSYTKADGANRAGNSYSSLWYFYYAAAPGATTITAAGTSTVDTMHAAWRVSGITSSSPLDTIGGGDNGLSSAPAVTATAGTSQADEIVFVQLASNEVNSVTVWPPNTGYTTLGQQNEDVRGRSTNYAYKIVSSTGTQSASSTFSTTPAWAFTLATFKAIAGIVKAGSAVIGP